MSFREKRHRQPDGEEAMPFPLETESRSHTTRRLAVLEWCNFMLFSLHESLLPGKDGSLGPIHHVQLA